MKNTVKGWIVSPFMKDKLARDMWHFDEAKPLFCLHSMLQRETEKYIKTQVYWMLTADNDEWRLSGTEIKFYA